MSSELKSSASSSSDEKARIERVDNVDADVEGSVDPRIHPEVYNAHIDTSGVDEKKLMRKLDWWLVPWLSFLYLLSFLDRTSIGNAKVRTLYSNRGIPVAYLGSMCYSCMAWRKTLVSTTHSTTSR